MLWGEHHAAYSPTDGVLDHHAGEPITTTINGVKRTINERAGQDAAALPARGRWSAGDERGLRRR